MHSKNIWVAAMAFVIAAGCTNKSGEDSGTAGGDATVSDTAAEAAADTATPTDAGYTCPVPSSVGAFMTCGAGVPAGAMCPGQIPCRCGGFESALCRCTGPSGTWECGNDCLGDTPFCGDAGGPDAPVDAPAADVSVCPPREMVRYDQRCQGVVPDRTSCPGVIPCYCGGTEPTLCRCEGSAGTWMCGNDCSGDRPGCGDAGGPG